MHFMKENSNLFTWIASDMPRIDLDFMCHHWSVYLEVHPVAHKKEKMSPDRSQAVHKQVKSLLKAGFIREI